MATKLKRSKLYSLKTKAFAVAVVLLAALTASVSLVNIADMRYGTDFLYSSYFDTETFYSQYSQLVRDVVNTKLVFKSEENIKTGNALNEEKVIYNFALDNGLGAYSMYNAVGGRPLKSYLTARMTRRILTSVIQATGTRPYRISSMSMTTP